MILHVDMDAFYASVEERDDPSLRGKPVIVGGTPEGRGVVAAANYAVRKFGVHSAMATAKALKLCPDAIVLRPRMEHYSAVSQKIRDIFHRYTPLVEPLSLDEAFLDATGSAKLFGSVEKIGREIKDAIRDELNLVASVGVAPNKFLAKLASDLDKPDGFTVVHPDRIQEVLAPLSVSRIWGVGKVTKRTFDRIGIKTIGQLRELSLERLQETFGQSGAHFWKLARGIDDRKVVADRETKSISHETTFPEDVTDLDVLKAWLLELTEQVARRLRKHKLHGKTVQLKVRYSNFDTFTRSKSLAHPTDATNSLWAVASELLTKQLPDRPLVVRLLGMGVSNFHKPTAVQQSLFGDEDDDVEVPRDSKLDTVADQIRSRFGSTSLRRASTVQHEAEHKPQPRPE
ncbi:DNA polymerase IV [Fuerstiella marisgermanici]|uniref:DNA polymerase IV n=1 Tax=Fuerstiella marisgermanici TaxID=1891926 RepID=A0A1P8WP41_9PLAN|nr:DNA polymerase IV [Fuerstiella marisgermanici]APZ95823.1 DNA polymerase IV [Fuerstiella marisgermanici]